MQQRSSKIHVNTKTINLNFGFSISCVVVTPNNKNTLSYSTSFNVFDLMFL